MANISFYGSHNAAYVVEDGGNILLVLEVERFLNRKNSGMAQYITPRADDIVFLAEYIAKYIITRFGITEFVNCYFLNTDVLHNDILYKLERHIPAKNYIECKHHEAHAAGSFYQSPYNEALIFSFDGGGNDGKFNIYSCKRGESPNLLEQVINPQINIPHIYYDLGFPYMIFAHFFNDINFEDLGMGNLIYPGKLMGLSSYGVVRHEWLASFMKFYKSNPDGIDYQEKINELGSEINVVFDINNRICGNLAYDLAATSQRAFEDSFIEIVKPYMTQYPDYPICISGGCGLNIILNTRLITEFKRDIFVGPDPNDCGIALGLMLNVLRPEIPYDSTYSGIEILDINLIQQYTNNANFNLKSNYLNTDILINDLVNGKIVGVARGNSEHGPRALGNRSILCNPMMSTMKDILNTKVKHREWYRPFSPVVRFEDVSKYFEWDIESRWMTFCPIVRKEWRDILPAITHIDNTARVQTVTREQNKWLYELLTDMEKKTGIGVLLNTSFNVNGKPILSTVGDAFEIFSTTELDCLVLEDFYIRKEDYLTDIKIN